MAPEKHAKKLNAPPMAGEYHSGRAGTGVIATSYEAACHQTSGLVFAASSVPVPIAPKASLMTEPHYIAAPPRLLTSRASAARGRAGFDFSFVDGVSPSSSSLPQNAQNAADCKSSPIPSSSASITESSANTGGKARATPSEKRKHISPQNRQNSFSGSDNANGDTMGFHCQHYTNNADMELNRREPKKRRLYVRIHPTIRVETI